MRKNDEATLTAKSVEAWREAEGLGWGEFGKYFSPRVTHAGANYAVYSHDPINAHHQAKLEAAMRARARWHITRHNAIARMLGLESATREE